ncbi:MAG: T9SS type A sorting domain-containing protein, partial [Candidatus Eisenbacteria sp.]|nr:T9SS type A sorting domain-containing protein [Candidatus Eisenbacteria bacterium]
EIDRPQLTISSSPNPCISLTQLRLTIPEGISEATLQIFDATGRTVRTLHEGSITAGMHLFQWTGKDAQGQPVPAGTYYCRAELGEQSAVSRIIRIQ